MMSSAKEWIGLEVMNRRSLMNKRKGEVKTGVITKCGELCTLFPFLLSFSLIAFFLRHDSDVALSVSRFVLNLRVFEQLRNKQGLEGGFSNVVRSELKK